MSFKVRRVAAAATLALACTAVPASAEIVHLTSGRTLSVKDHRVEGDSIVLTLRSGGEVTCDRTLVEKIVPDEVPYEDPLAAPAAQQPEAKVITPGPLLERTPY